MTVPHRSFGLLWQTALFLAIFGMLQYTWTAWRGGAIARFLVEDLTVKTAVSLINLFSPSTAAAALGTHISAPGGGINVISGCEGVEIMFMLTAAMAIAPIAWRAKVAGLLIGIAVVFLLNQVRLIAMFYAVRNDRVLFDMLHGTIAPIVLIALTAVFFSWWLGLHGVGQTSDGNAD